jgi:D-serine dehydratase
MSHAKQSGLPGSDRALSGWMKGMPSSITSATSQEIAALQLNLLREEVPLPCAVIMETVLARNEEWMLKFARAAGVELCPHGKTTMSPELLARQLAGGAWGITAATPHQLRTMRAFGIRRILYANQLVGRAALRYVMDELNRDLDFDFYCLVDSVASVELLAAAAVTALRPVQVLLEVGQDGGRTGTRNHTQALAVARAVSQYSTLRLTGLETYEFMVAGRDDAEREGNVARLFNEFTTLAKQLDHEELFRTPQVLLSAGGSAYFDLAAQALTSIELDRPVIPVIRSGCYLTHDHGWLPGYFERMRARSTIVAAVEGRPTGAIEIWAYIQSRPEAGRALATLGKRDVSFDIRLPQPTLWFRPGFDTGPQALTDGTSIEALNDQHAYLRVPPDSPLRVGDMIGVGISHPCTTFDKWRGMLLVDDAYNVTGAISTWF